MAKRTSEELAAHYRALAEKNERRAVLAADTDLADALCAVERLEELYFDVNVAKAAVELQIKEAIQKAKAT